MRANIAVQFIIGCCLTCFTVSMAVCAEEPAATPKSLAQLEQEYKALIDAKKGSESYKILGQIWAADPARISDALPDTMKTLARMKAGEGLMHEVLTPAAKDCVPVLIKMLQSDEKVNHYPASAGLRTIRDAARPALEELLFNGTVAQRAEVIRILGSDRQPMAAESTAAKLKTVLQDREPELQVEATIALLNLKVDDARIANVLEQNFPKFGERIMQDALRGSKISERLRGVLTLAMNQKENRNWRIESALQLASLDTKLSKPVQATIIEGLSKQQSDSYRLAEKCATTLGLPSDDAKDSIQALTRLCHDGSTSLDLAAAAAATLIQIDQEHAPAYVPYLLTIINRPRYRLEKAKYLAIIGKLGKHGTGAASALRDILPREGGTCDLLMAIVLLHIDPEHPEQAYEFIRAALAGKKEIYTIGLNQWKGVTFDCTPLIPEFQAAIESDDVNRHIYALDLLQFCGSSAIPLVPVLEKKLPNLKVIKEAEQKAFREMIDQIKSAKP